MTAQPASRPEQRFVACIEDAHQHAELALDEGRTLDAVVWLSAHLAATLRSLHRPARHLLAARPLLADQLTLDRRLERMLRIAEQRHSGDALAAALDEDRLERALRAAVVAHVRHERRLLTVLVDVLDEGALADLEAAYGAALEQAPTRPHPHAPHTGVLGVAAFRVDAWRDRVMDTMDSRHVPTPRPPRAAVVPGRWGSYLLGEMEP
ncbi:MAG: hypothetical protein QOF18_665 [Frankiaceae bacterium]|jgi:hypothetical protein|nr:hypothetical protein [Frankiaceae bacterium]